MKKINYFIRRYLRKSLTAFGLLCTLFFTYPCPIP
nr:MAG TPA: hypothetical protein [Caudoviricetes sp.]DAN50070.1 MAG TPA: hypothetical protein [Caudoviricetes sp.]